jgi:hypothetical protein
LKRLAIEISSGKIANIESLFKRVVFGWRADIAMPLDETLGSQASAGHKLGQSVGDWFEQFFVLPLLQDVAARVNLFLDTRFSARPARGPKLSWPDEHGNEVDYDFVLEVDGSAEQRGVPVGFVECFWRRGARHSKDKARDDTGKLRPMRDTYPTARFLGIVVTCRVSSDQSLLENGADRTG